MEQVRVSVCALDPITKAGTAKCLDSYDELSVLSDLSRAAADVVVGAFESLSAGAVRALRASAEQVGKPIVLLVNDVRESELPIVVECRVAAILPRAAVTDGRAVESILSAAAGGAGLPPNLLGQLVEHTDHLYREVLEPAGLAGPRLSPREVDVLRFMADGLDTLEIARKLSYSERTVKNIIYAITTRLNLRNRPHAVAYAMRAGVI